MNQFFYESRGREKVRELMEEGMRNQVLHRSGAAAKRGISRGIPKLILILATLMGLFSLLAH